MKELKQGYCMYCHKHKTIRALRSWNNPEKVSYFCDKHYTDAENYESESRRRFIEYYSEEEARKYLSDKQRRLWEELSRKYR